MNASRARSTAERVIGGLLDADIDMYARDQLLSDDGVVHLANAYKQIEHADRSGVSLSEVSDAYGDVETALRWRVHDILIDTVDDAPNRSEHEDLAAVAKPAEADTGMVA